MKNYTKNYIKIYFWQGLSILLGFLSMFIVTPYISGNKGVFGIYSVCISVSIFLAYADLGFVSAGQKFAAEEYAKSNLESEQKIVGFSGFILFVFVLICSFVFLYLGFNPKKLIPTLNFEEVEIASKLLIILAFSSPIVVLQRITQMIFSIRIDDYIFQRIKILGSIAKITSVLYFFREGVYNIVGYYLFMQIVNFVVSLLALKIANRRYSYNLTHLFRAFKFNKETFDKTSGLAITSLFLTISWVLYYECDNFAIGRILGASDVAVFAIGLTLMSFLRTILGTIFSPFASRFNHYVGLNDPEGLKKSFTKILSFTFPVVVYVIVTIILLMKPLILSWVGIEYYESIKIAKFLVACNILAFIAYPTGILLSAQLRLKEMYLLGGIIPIIYWVGIILTYNKLGLVVFGYFKLLTFIISGIIYLILLLKYLDMSLWKFFNKFILKNIPFLIVLIVVLYFFRDNLQETKNKIGLLKVVSFGGFTALTCLSCTYLLNKDIRIFIMNIIKKK